MANKVKIIGGTQRGDEGKGKETSWSLSNENHKLVGRFAGGSNAGHTVRIGDIDFKSHQLPSGVFNDVDLGIFPGCIFNIGKTLTEIDDAQSKGAKLDGRLHISDQVTIVQPHHILLDRLFGRTVASTGNGISPAVADRAMRMYGDHLAAVTLGNLMDSSEYIDVMHENFQRTWTTINQVATMYRVDVNNLKLNNKEKEEFQKLMKKEYFTRVFSELLERMSKYVERDPLFLRRKAEEGNVLLEGAQAFLLDPLLGTYPYNTATHTLPAYSLLFGIPLDSEFEIVGVAKALFSAVGNGPFPSEFGGPRSEEYCMEDGGNAHKKESEKTAYYHNLDELLRSDDPLQVGIALRMLSEEYGSTTERPRRIGALDLVVLRHAAKIMDLDYLVLNKCDDLALFSRTRSEKIPVVVGYELDGERIDYVPTTVDRYRRVVPVYEHLDSFTEDLSEMRDYNKMPKALKTFVSYVEDHVGIPLR
ncbi:MAG: adenylosuccinate synthetase [Candidatus Aenigmarchaeota archaeon]|nr:adenylosuccinate synthetase [Candidatus Aenigmarchaeota archaeon]